MKIYTTVPIWSVRFFYSSKNPERNHVSCFPQKKKKCQQIKYFLNSKSAY